MNKKYIISVDIESNGLDGRAFAASAIIFCNEDKKVLQTENYRCPIIGEVDSFVKDNVLPALNEMPINCESEDDMYSKFYKNVILPYYSDGIIIAHMSFPVETNFFNNLKKYTKDEMIIINDVATLLLIANKNIYSVDEYVKKHILNVKTKPHDPAYDAYAALLVWNDIVNRIEYLYSHM